MDKKLCPLPLSPSSGHGEPNSQRPLPHWHIPSPDTMSSLSLSPLQKSYDYDQYQLYVIIYKIKRTPKIFNRCYSIKKYCVKASYDTDLRKVLKK